MTSFAKYFHLGKTQAELDFVDVPVNGDVALFLDPFAISQRTDRWSQGCHYSITAFFGHVIEQIRQSHQREALNLLRFLREPNETRLGFSKGKPAGAGIGRDQSRQLFDALSDSTAVRTGFINSLEECELMIDGISWDKISDLTTNIIRKDLARYTLDQCQLHGVPTRLAALSPFFDPESLKWRSEYLELPIAVGRPVLLVPKAFVRYQLAYDYHQYYSDFAVEYLQAEHLSANSSLVQTLRNGRQIVYKKDIEATFPCTKESLFRFSREHPDVLKKYREHLQRLERSGDIAEIMPEDEQYVAQALGDALKSIKSGPENASSYHNLMVGVMEFLFYPNLLYPKKEREIHEGRKRIDIVMDNGARSGIFERLHSVRNLPSAYVAFECKNYTTEIANPELDQLSGRFSPNRGKVGFICCRTFEDRSVFIRRCQDTFKDDRGLIIPLDDETILGLLELVVQQKRTALDKRINQLVDEVWLS